MPLLPQRVSAGTWGFPCRFRFLIFFLLLGVYFRLLSQQSDKFFERNQRFVALAARGVYLSKIFVYPDIQNRVKLTFYRRRL